MTRKHSKRGSIYVHADIDDHPAYQAANDNASTDGMQNATYDPASDQAANDNEQTPRYSMTELLTAVLCAHSIGYDMGKHAGKILQVTQNAAVLRQALFRGLRR